MNKTLLLHCYTASPIRRQLFKVEEAAQKNGFKYELETLLAYGASANIRYPRLYEAIISGPIGGVIGAKTLLNEIKGLDNVVCCDLGGTTFDVGIITRGMMPINPEPEFAGHKLTLPMVSLDSIGAGAGSVIHVDSVLKRVTIGPESAGARVGVCYKYPEITIADVDLALGYLNPDYFLGGSVRIDKQAALNALEERLARPLGEDVYAASSKVLQLLHSSLVECISASLLSKGYRPEEYTLIAYGGSGPLHLWGIEEGLNWGRVCTCPWTAAFSAYGVAASDYFYRYERTVTCVLGAEITPGVRLQEAQKLNKVWKELEEKGVYDLQRGGIEAKDIRFKYRIFARYLGQMFSLEVPLERGRIETDEDLEHLISSFERVYSSIYPRAAHFPEAGYVITEVVLEAHAKRPKPVIPEYPLRGQAPPKNSYKGQRDVYHKNSWIKFDIWEMDLLEAGNRVDGPAIIEHPMTTLVIPPDRYIEIDQHKLMWYRRRN